MKKGPKTDLTGLKTGQLEVLRVVGQTKRGVWLWECKCSCGDFRTITGGQLTRKVPAKSCGCHKKRAKIDQGEISTDSLVRQLMGHYKQSAERRKIEFSLHAEDFKVLIFSHCYYCGTAPTQTYRPTQYRSSLKYNGIDRASNSMGYVYSNCVTCCKNCNRAKSDLSMADFFILVEKIHQRIMQDRPRKIA